MIIIYIALGILLGFFLIWGVLRLIGTIKGNIESEKEYKQWKMQREKQLKVGENGEENLEIKKENEEIGKETKIILRIGIIFIIGMIIVFLLNN